MAWGEQDLRNIAAYYAGLTPKFGQAQGDDEQIAAAQDLYRGGSLPKGVAACSACHGPNGGGNGPAGFPRTVSYTHLTLPTIYSV